MRRARPIRRLDPYGAANHSAVDLIRLVYLNLTLNQVNKLLAISALTKPMQSWRREHFSMRQAIGSLCLTSSRTFANTIHITALWLTAG